MPRVARVKSKSKIYHIMIRGINQQNIFSVDEDYEKFIAILSKYHKKSEYEIYAYCLMGNHIHLLIKEGKEALSNSMKRIGTSYVSWYNWQYNRKGHLFQDRYKRTKTGGRFFVWQSPITVSKIDFYRDDFYAWGNKKDK